LRRLLQLGCRQPRSAATTIAAALGIAWAVQAATLAHAQQAATLNGYRAAPLPSDGFVLSGADVGKHLELSLQLHADYANDPLVFEDVAGQVGTERVALVSDQLTLHPSVALSLYDAAVVYLAMPVHAVLTGTRLGMQPTGTGFGPGDFAFGGRLRIQSSDFSRIALQMTVTLPSGEKGQDGRPGVAGDAGATVEPRIAAELFLGPVELMLDAGVRLREDASFAGARFTDVFTFGAGLRVPLLDRRLFAVAELFGEAPIDDVGDRTGSPLQGLVGVRLLPIERLMLGLAGGAGLLRGYGAPDTRIALSLGYTLPLSDGPDESEIARAKQPEARSEPELARIEAPAVSEGFGSEPAETIEDRDRDGVADTDDRCPAAPGLAQLNGCPEHIEYDEAKGAITFLQAVRFGEGGATLKERGEASLADVLALLEAYPQMKVRVEAHLTLGRRGDLVSGLRTSAARATAVAGFLVDHGVASARLEAVGCAANRPLVPDVGSQRFKNERVEVHVLEPLPAAGIRSSLGCIPGDVPGAAPPAAKPAPPALTPAPAPPATTKPAPPPPAPAAAPKPAAAPPPAPAPKPAAAPPPPPPPVAPVPKPPAAAPAPPPPPPAPAAPPAAPVAPKIAAPAAVAAGVGAATVLAALAREPKGDADRDGVANAEDACPLAPRSPSGTEPGCPEGHKVDLDTGRIELTRPIRFEEAASTPSERSAAHLDELAATLRANPSMRVLIEAHLAEEGSAEASLALTRARAAAVRSALTTRGIPQARMRAYGCGQLRPVAPNNVPWGRKRNERVEVHVLDPAPASGVHSADGCVATE
jgi:outer membrane protein OmpA-like peptidoglycan-associated protein